MNIYQYVAINNPNGARSIVEEYGVRANRQKLGKQLAYVVAKNGNEALDKVASIHPDLPLFQKQIDDFKEKIKKDCDSKSNSNFLNADGQQIKAEISSLKETVNNSRPSDDGKSKVELLIIGGVIVFGLALILRK